MPRFPRRRVATLAMLLPLLATRAEAQPRERHGGTMRALGVNALIGSAAAAMRAAASGAPLWPAVARGAFGGAVMTGGFATIGAERAEFRFVGLQLTAVGASISRNAGDDRPMLSSLTLPLFPFVVQLRPGEPTPVRLRLSAVSTLHLLGSLTGRDAARVDWHESLLSGAPVMRSGERRLSRTDCGESACDGAFAEHNGGIVVYAASAGVEYDLERTLAHESLHLAQHTRDLVLHAEPLGDAVMSRLGAPGRAMARLVVLDFALPLKAVNVASQALTGTARRESWYEREARAFAPGGEIFSRAPRP